MEDCVVKTVYITKYALSDKGIFTAECELSGSGDGWIRWRQPDMHTIYLPKSSYANTKQEAIEQAELMRKKKLISLQKRIKKIREMDFKKKLFNEDQ